FHTQWETGLWSGAVAHYLRVNYLTEVPANLTRWPDLPRWVDYHSALRDQGKPHILKCPEERFPSPLSASKVAVSYGWNTADYGMGINDSYTMEYNAPGLTTYRDRYKRVRDAMVVKPAQTVLAGEHYSNPVLASGGLYEYRTSQFSKPSDLGTLHD